MNDSHGHDVNPGCDRDPRVSTPSTWARTCRRLFNTHRT